MRNEKDECDLGFNIVDTKGAIMKTDRQFAANGLDVVRKGHREVMPT